MSDRELCMEMLNNIPDSKIGYVLAYIQGLTAADEDADAAYCEALYREYEASGDKGETMTLEDVAGLLGVEL